MGLCEKIVPVPGLAVCEVGGSDVDKLADLKVKWHVVMVLGRVRRECRYPELKN